MHINRLLAAALAMLIVTALGSVAPQPVSAANDIPVTIAVTAMVDEVSDPYNVLGTAIRPGDRITGTYTYNAATVDYASSLPNAGTYFQAAPYGIHLTVGGYVFETDPQNVHYSISIHNNVYGRDRFGVGSSGNRPLSPTLTIPTIYWELTDLSQTVFKNDSLPKTAPKLSSWSTNVLQIDSWDPTITDPSEDYTFRILSHVTQAQKITR